MLRLNPAPSDLGHADVALDLPGARRANSSPARLRPRAAGDASMQPWILELGSDAEAFVRPLDGWIGARVRLAGGEFGFATRAEAETFARRHGWVIEADLPDAESPH